MIARRIAARLAVGALLVQSRALAQPVGSVTLDWRAPDECPSGAAVQAQIQRLLGAGARASLQAHAAVEQVGAAAWQAEVEVIANGDKSSRRIEGDSCEALADAVALIVSVASAPAAASPTPHPDRVPSPAATNAPPSPIISPASGSPGRLALTLAVGASGLIDSGSLPTGAYGGVLFAGLHPAHVELNLEGALLASVRGTTAARPKEGADFWLARLGLRGCYDVFDATFDAGPCAALGFEWTTANGSGADVPAKATGQTIAASLGARIMARFSPRGAVRLGLEGVVPATRPSYVINGTGQVFQPPALASRGTIGVELDF